jgi:NADH:quinone reductase (non-electrogenic)
MAVSPETSPGHPPDPTPGTRHRVVIIGSGFGGLFAAKFLRSAPVDVILIDRTNHHVFQPLLYQVATGILSPGQIAPPTRDVLKKHRNVRVEVGDVKGFDLGQRTVTVQRPGGRVDVVGYDSLIVAAGVGQSYFGHDEFAEYAPGMKTIADALRQRERILTAFERAELEEDPELRRAWLTFAVVGGGPTGVEIAGQIAEMAHRAMRRNYRRFDPDDVNVVLYEGGKEILATFGDSLSRRATRELEKTGVEIHTGSIVIGIDAEGVDVKGPDGSTSRLPAKTVIWAAGVQASPLAARLATASGAQTDRAGRIEVLPDCTIPGHPEVFAIGDMMSLDGLPGVAEVAMQSGIHAARTIKGRVETGASSKPFVYRDLGSMAAVSRRRAIVSFHGVHLWGFPGWIAWLFVHLAFLTGFKNRFRATMSWFFNFVGRSRSERAIVEHVIPNRFQTPS